MNETLPIEEKIRSFTELSELANYLSNDRWCYRGVLREEYELIPKICRKGILKYEEKEYEYLNEFKRRVKQYVDIPSYESDLEWEALAQHHGFPTRLLDWSESIFVAAFFATEHSGIENNEPVNAAIYGMPEKDYPNTKMHYPSHISPRITAQSGLFTFHAINPEKPFEPERVHKWVIDSKNCLDIKIALSKVGIHYGTMFPDIDGLCKQLTWKMKLGL